MKQSDKLFMRARSQTPISYLVGTCACKLAIGFKLNTYMPDSVYQNNVPNCFSDGQGFVIELENPIVS